MSAWSAPMCFADVWTRAVERAPEAVFLVFERPDGGVLTWTYGEFDHLVERVASCFAERGVGLDDAVHLALANSPAFLATWFAANRLGAWIVPSDPMARQAELEAHLDRTRPVLGVCSRQRADVYRAAAGIRPTMHVLEVAEDDGALDVFTAGSLAPRPALRWQDRAAVMFTSGTTGRPKGVEVTQANYAFAGKVMAEAAGLEAHHRQLVVLPMFHANAQYYSVASAVWAGASVALMHTFSASGFCDQAARHAATHASLFAAPIRMILVRGAHHPSPSARAAMRLEHCWYAMNIADDQHAALTELFGCAPRQLYGMTETIPAVLTDRPEAPVPSSMGFVSPGCEVDLHRPDGTSAAPGEVGQIVVRGEAGITMFAGYLDDHDTTAASFRNGWFLTGDRARRDAEGRWYFDGRRSDVLKVAGENVSTVEVEQVLSSHPQVLEAAVIGAPDPVRDEVPVGFVVATDPLDPPSTKTLMRWCEEHLSKAKRPREITFVSELPRTSVGKIRKFLLRDPNDEGAAVPVSAEPMSAEPMSAETMSVEAR